MLQRAHLYSYGTCQSVGNIGKKSAQTVLKRAICLVTKWIEFVEIQIFLNCEKNKDGICWTGSKVDFVELGYGFRGTQCVNNGQISLDRLFKFMSKAFNFEVNDYARVFMDIKNRTAKSPTKFLDTMRHSVAQQIDEANLRPPRK
jgi:hypothetical protein